MTDPEEGPAADSSDVEVLEDAGLDDAEPVDAEFEDLEGTGDGSPEEADGDGATTTDDDPTPAAERLEARAAVEEAFYDALESAGRPAITAGEFARATDRSHAAAEDALADLPVASRLDVPEEDAYYPEDLSELVDRERVVVFPDRREILVNHPEQFTLARLSSFARLVTTNGDGGYCYEIRDADVWAAPYDDLGELLVTIRDVAGRWPSLEEFVESQWNRARKFTLCSEEDYTVLEAASDDLMGNVAMQHLEEGEHVRGLISDTEAWVVEDGEAEIKRILYDAGYPVRDDRDLETGEDLPVDLDLELRDYQRDWVDRFTEKGSGVLVGPPGSGKTVAAMGIMAELEGETLILVPSRELAGQWHDELLAKTSLEPDQVGEYHGGTKEMAPVTIATYQTAGMDRHRHLFDSREWGLVVLDEVQHVPAPIYRQAAPTGPRCSRPASSPGRRSKSATSPGATRTPARSTTSPRATTAGGWPR